MSALDAAILGVIQGATEFLPVSSSAHLVIGQYLLGVTSPGVLLEVVLHLGTLLSVLIYFRHDLRNLIVGSLTPGEEGVAYRQEIGLLILATVPAVIVALTLKNPIEAAFDSVFVVGIMLLVTTAILLSSRWVPSRDTDITLFIALIMGLAQAMAIFPGISRSGITIVAGLWLGLSGTTAARFSFLMALPAITGAALFKVMDGPGDQSLTGLTVGLVLSAIVGYAVIAWLLDILRRGRLHLFAGYTLLVGLVVIFRF